MKSSVIAAEPASVQTSQRSWHEAGALVLVLLTLVWSYWPTLSELVAFWSTNDDYSVGALTPLAAGYLIWLRRRELSRLRWRGDWSGLVLVAFSQLLRFVSIYYAYASIERLSLVIAISGMIAFLFGWTVWRRLAPVQLFLLLMVPPPQSVHDAISLPLQTLATKLGVFGLELLGYLVQRDGNQIQLESGAAVFVAEACSGLRMLTAFVFTAGLLALLVNRPVWQKLTLVACSVPIAVAINGVRLVVTALAVEHSDSELVHQQVHDIAGFAMMPPALLVLGGLLVLMKWLSDPTPPRSSTQTVTA